MSSVTQPLVVQMRPAQADDWGDIWRLLEPVFRAGETYAVDREITEEAARGLWVESPTATWVGTDGAGTVVGTYYLKPNQSGPGAHVCNCGYVVSPQARGQGVAAAMCEHSQAEAVRLQYRAMQFNLVVETNAGAVKLWKRLGFHEAGRLPGAFAHPQQGWVDALVFYKDLTKS